MLLDLHSFYPFLQICCEFPTKSTKTKKKLADSLSSRRNGNLLRHNWEWAAFGRTGARPGHPRESIISVVVEDILAREEYNCEKIEGGECASAEAAVAQVRAAFHSWPGRKVGKGRRSAGSDIGACI